MNPSVIIWLDLETTGLDILNDKILEVGIIITDWKLNQLDIKDWVIHHPDNVMDNLVPVVQKMHTDNGLINLVKESIFTSDDVERYVINFLTTYQQPNTKFIMAGNSINFDKSFIQTHMPTLSQLFHHRIIDMTSLRLLTENWSPNINSKILKDMRENRKDYNSHRALDDIKWCLLSAQMSKKYLFN